MYALVGVISARPLHTPQEHDTFLPVVRVAHLAAVLTSSTKDGASWSSR